MPLDGVRVISNISTGTLGQLIAAEAARKGAKVTLLEGPVTEPFKKTTVRVIKFRFYEELYRALKTELKRKYDVVIHAAAVSDYAVQGAGRKKISSDLKKVVVRLKPTRKIIAAIKKWNKNVRLVGFKLDPDITRQNALKYSRALIRKAGCDFVVANNLAHNRYRSFIINPDGEILAARTTRLSTAKTLVKLL